MIRFIKSSQGFGLIGILIVVAVIALAGGGGMYWSETKKQQSLLQIGADAKKRAEELKKQIEAKQNDVSKELGENLKPRSSVDTSVWKTYRNEKYGFEVKYPSEASPQIRSIDPVDAATTGAEFLLAFQFSSDYSIGDAYLLVIYQNNENLSPEKQFDYRSDTTREIKVINGISTVRLSSKLAQRVSYYFRHTSKFYSIEWPGYYENNKDLNTFNKFVESFNFFK